jgi:hypothetical protein
MRRVAACFALTLLACGGLLSEGEAEFNRGHYAEARDTLVRAEVESRAWSDAQRAEYALYRGLSHGALGERREAALWLHEAKAIADSKPGALSEEDATRLNTELGSTDLTRVTTAP